MCKHWEKGILVALASWCDTMSYQSFLLLQVNFFGKESVEEKAAIFKPLRALKPVEVCSLPKQNTPLHAALSPLLCSVSLTSTSRQSLESIMYVGLQTFRHIPKTVITAAALQHMFLFSSSAFKGKCLARRSTLLTCGKQAQGQEALSARSWRPCCVSCACRARLS